MSWFSLTSFLATVVLTLVSGGNVKFGAFEPAGNWKAKPFMAGTQEHEAHLNRVVTFHVAMEYVNKKEMEDEFLAVSTPSHPAYGKHLRSYEIRSKYISEEGIEIVTKHFKSIPSSSVEVNEIGSMIKVTAKIANIEKHLSTTISPHFLRTKKIGRAHV